VQRAFEYERRVYERLDLILPRSEWLGRSFIEDFGSHPDKVVAVGAGLNLQTIPEVPERDFATPRLLFVGKDFKRKGGEQLLAAFARLRQRRPDAELWIVGPEDPPTTLPGVRSFGRINRDTPTGDGELLRLYREATVFVMPSIFEPWGSVFLEAMACALPCIGSDCCAMPEIVLQGATGYLAAPGSVDSLDAVLASVVDDPLRARAMGRAGRRRVLDHFTWDHVAGRIVAAISSRLEDRTSAGAELDRVAADLGVEGSR
jgi:glycosyltransferase involved in cell wall biosynthesis